MLSGKSVPIVKAPSGQISNAPTNIMEEGEVYAIETFASTGRGHVSDEGECSHYMKDANAHFVALRLKSAKDLLKTIDEVRFSNSCSRDVLETSYWPV